MIDSSRWIMFTDRTEVRNYWSQLGKRTVGQHSECYWIAIYERLSPRMWSLKSAICLRMSANACKCRQMVALHAIPLISSRIDFHRFVHELFESIGVHCVEHYHIAFSLNFSDYLWIVLILDERLLLREYALCVSVKPLGCCLVTIAN